MKLKKYFGPSDTVMKSSEARDPQQLPQRPLQFSSSTSSISSSTSSTLMPSSTLIASSASMTSTPSIPMTTLKPSSDQPKNDTPIPVIDLTQINTLPAKKGLDA
ncbi:unnamed protein product [Rhizophagus irregularis]|nr:unnamed protein product [Rhizophagus irregularis]